MMPFNVPALTVWVVDMLATLRKVAGAKAADHVTVTPDPAVEAVVGSWPAVLDNRRAADLRRIPDASFESVVGAYAPVTLGRWPIARSDE